MEIATIQVFVSVVLILAAAGVALWYDFLKRRNDHLRKAMAELELQSQREEEMPVGVSGTSTVSRAMPPPLPAPAPAAVEQVPVDEAVPVSMAVEESVAIIVKNTVSSLSKHCHGHAYDQHNHRKSDQYVQRLWHPLLLSQRKRR